MQYDGRDPKEFAIGTLYVDCSFNLNVVQNVEPYVCDGVIHDYSISGTDVYTLSNKTHFWDDEITSVCSLNNCGLEVITNEDEETFAKSVYIRSSQNIKSYYFTKDLLDQWVYELKHKSISSFMKNQHSEFCENIFDYYTTVKLTIKDINEYYPTYILVTKRFMYSYINALEIIVSACKDFIIQYDKYLEQIKHGIL